MEQEWPVSEHLLNTSSLAALILSETAVRKKKKKK